MAARALALFKNDMYYTNDTRDTGTNPMTYTWHIQIESEVHAVCKNDTHVLHDLVISDHPTTEEEAKEQAKTIVKMRALKDVLNLAWSADEAAQYAIANAAWLENKLLDSARKRWGAADFLAEKWLLVGAYLGKKNVSQWASNLSVSETLKDFVAHLDNDLHAFGQINQLALQTKIGECKRHGLLRSGEWIYCQGVMLQTQVSEHAYVAVVLSDEGQWQFMIVEKHRSSYGRIESWSSPPTLEEARTFFSDTPDSEIEKLIEIK